jgi:membrane associated rhomboid family serine protease
MLPLRDNISSRTFPVINYAMIALCTVCFLAQLASQGDGRDELIEKYGMIPARIGHPDAEIAIPVEGPRGSPGNVFGTGAMVLAEKPPFAPIFTLLTCVFLHGGWGHFLGNMWFLHIFGDNVEDRLGHLGYLIFYLLAGVAASLGHYLAAVNSGIPTIGASGAIAGVMGAYMVLYPRSMVMSLIPLGFLTQVVAIPAPVFLGIWFVIQLLSGTAGSSEGVAWWAHIGGFVFGAAIAFLLKLTGLTNPQMEYRRQYREPFTRYRVLDR